MNHHPAEVFAVHSVVASECGGVEIEDDFLIFEIMVIVAEVVHQVGQLAPVLDEKRLYDVQPVPRFVRLTDGEAVDVRVKVERYAEWAVRLKVAVHAAVHLT